MKGLIYTLLALFIMLGSVGCHNGVGVGVSIDVENITPIIDDQPQLMYSVKFICGTIPHSANPQSPLSGQPLVPGTYLTAINIYNPHEFEVSFSKRAVVTNPQGQDRGKVGDWFPETLGPNEGVEVDCSNIYTLLPLPSPPEFLKGFVVIKTAPTPTQPQIKLDVTAVYTLKNVVSKNKN